MIAFWLYVLVLLAAVLLLAHRLLVSRRPAWRRRRVARLARRAGLPGVPLDEGGDVPDALVDRLGARVARREVGSVAGGLLGVAGTLLLAAAGSELDRRGARLSGSTDGFALELSLLPVVGPLLVVVGQLLGVLVVAAREALSAPAVDGRRLARATTPLLVDYVPRLETTLVRLLCAGPLLLTLLVGAVVLVVRGGPPSQHTALLVVTAAAVALWAAVEAASRRVLAQGQPAGSALELAWDDVLRARVLRDLVQVPVLLGALATGLLVVLLLPELLRSAGTGELVATAAVVSGLLVPAAGLVALLVSLLVRPSEQYVRRRLWPVPEAVAGAR